MSQRVRFNSSSAILPCGPLENTLSLYYPRVGKYFRKDNGSGPHGNMVGTSNNKQSNTNTNCTHKANCATAIQQPARQNVNIHDNSISSWEPSMTLEILCPSRLELSSPSRLRHPSRQPTGQQDYCRTAIPLQHRRLPSLLLQGMGCLLLSSLWSWRSAQQHKAKGSALACLWIACMLEVSAAHCCSCI